MKLRKRGKIILISILILSTMAVGCTNEKGESKTLSKTEFLMDTVMTVKVFDYANEDLMEDIFDRLREIEAKMSVTIDTSDISVLNQNAGVKPVKVDKETYLVLKKAKEYAKLSNGHYDPTIGPLVDLWDVKSEEKDRDSIPSKDEIKEKMELIDYSKLELLDNQNVFLMEKNMKVNLGSIVKGYATDQVKKILTDNGVKGAIIDLGGNIYAYGDKEGEKWRIGVQDPNKATGIAFGTLNIRNKSIVSSGSYERYFTYKNKRYHHILNPKTGYPAENELFGVTVVSDESIDGDALSTSLFVLGLEEGKKLASELDGIEAIFMTYDDEVYIPKKYDEESIFTDLTHGFGLNIY